ncbi:MAG: YdaU family protein [Gemmatimonadales bacterium]|nr:YdaU family protein [Gemmatimonadales bacterium]
MKNTPAFQYYPADLISDPDVMSWNMEEVGCYWWLISAMWLNGGKLQNNETILRRLTRINGKKKWKKIWETINVKFQVNPDCITHKRVTHEMEVQAEKRLSRKNAGKKGAKKRWQTDSNAIVLPMANDSTSSSSSSSLATNNNNACAENGKAMAKEAEEIDDVVFPETLQTQPIEPLVDELIAKWDSFAAKKSNGSVLAVQSELSRVLMQTDPVIPFSDVLAAMDNYRTALALPDSQAPQHQCANWLSKHLKKYLLGYFDVDHYDAARYGPPKKPKREPIADRIARLEAENG